MSKISFYQKFINIPILLIITVIGLLLFGDNIALEVKRFFYTVSLTIKNLIIFLLPILIFSLLFQSIAKISNGATSLVFFLLIAISLSNLFSTSFSYIFANFAYSLPCNGINKSLADNIIGQDLTSLWNLQLPTIIPNNYALLGGLIVGLLAKYTVKIGQKISSLTYLVSQVILRGVKILIFPFIFGFLIKMEHDNIISSLMEKYGVIMLIIIVAQIFYLSVGYLFLSKGNGKKFITLLKNMLPPALTSFGSMSSATAMPLTIISVKQNAEVLRIKNSVLTNSTVPATANVHLVGDCIAIPILAYAILKSYNIDQPTVIQYIIFALYFILAKFSVAAIPGGGIIVMLPILQEYMGFNSDMMSLITTLYILFDPVITCVNVLGNGCFSLIFMKIIKKT